MASNLLTNQADSPEGSGENLTNNDSPKQRGTVLTRNRDKSFKLSIEIPLHHKYCFQFLNKKDLLALDKFIDETVGNNLTISEVDKLFLRTKGKPFSKENINGTVQKVVHYGKNKKSFRIHGYYNEDYFVIYQIDPQHKKHKQK